MTTYHLTLTKVEHHTDRADFTVMNLLSIHPKLFALAAWLLWFGWSFRHSAARFISDLRAARRRIDVTIQLYQIGLRSLAWGVLSYV